MNNYQGTIIEESLTNKEILERVNIISTRSQPVTTEQQTPWLTQWTLHNIEVDDSEADTLASELSRALDSNHGWYIDYRNTAYHYVIFKNRVFKITRNKKTDYEAMIKYGLAVGTPHYQLPNFADLPLDILSAFLREANFNTYANENIKKAASLRPGSKDYHFAKDNLVYHDTYFGSTKFMGAEIVYKDGRCAWGMNYYGFTLDDKINEELFDAILRPALMSGSGDNIPVRGPKEFINGKWKYTFNVTGNLANFTGLEEISQDAKVVCRLYCHGGLIE